jgi:hypothetical protein
MCMHGCGGLDAWHGGIATTSAPTLTDLDRYTVCWAAGGRRPVRGGARGLRQLERGAGEGAAPSRLKASSLAQGRTVLPTWTSGLVVCLPSWGNPHYGQANSITAAWVAVCTLDYGVVPKKNIHESFFCTSNKHDCGKSRHNTVTGLCGLPCLCSALFLTHKQESYSSSSICTHSCPSCAHERSTLLCPPHHFDCAPPRSALDSPTMP